MEDSSHIKDETDSLPNTNSFILRLVKEEIIDDQSYNSEDVFNSNSSTPESFNVCEDNTLVIKTETDYELNVQKSMSILNDGSLETNNLPNRNPSLLGSIKEEIIDYPDSDNYNQSFNIEDVNIINNSNNITPEINVENDCRNISEHHSTFIIENSSPVKDEDNIFPITTPSLLGFIKEESITNENNYEVNELFHNEDESNTIKFENYNIGAENNLGVKKEKYCRNMDVPNSVTIKECLVKGETDGSTDDFITHTGLLPVKKNNRGKIICAYKRLCIINMYMANVERDPDKSLRQIRKIINSMGIVESIIHKIIKEYKEKKLVTSPKRTRVRKSFRETFDDLARNTVRRHVQDICFRHEISTVDKIHQVVSNDESLPPISRTNLFHLLKELDFRYCKKGNKWV